MEEARRKEEERKRGSGYKLIASNRGFQKAVGTREGITGFPQKAVDAQGPSKGRPDDTAGSSPSWAGGGSGAGLNFEANCRFATPNLLQIGSEMSTMPNVIILAGKWEIGNLGLGI